MESGPDNSISNEKELQDAVVQGDVALLRQLLQRDPFILHRPLAAMATSSFYPLHVACRLGHLSFVSELLRLHPELSEVVDPNDQSSTPLHIAARTGQLDVVKVLVTANPSACFARDSQGRNPVHVAVARNCLAVLDELTGASPAAARERVAVTAGGGGGRGDTIMHLCLNQGTLEALELLVDKLGNIAILNAGDGDGNTILHLAATNKQIETIKFLLKDARINVKAQNSDGFTAMDVVSSWHKACDNHEASVNKEIKYLFRRARVSRYLYAGQYNSTKKPEYIGKWIENQKSNLIVVASLIATMAFQAGINPPVVIITCM